MLTVAVVLLFSVQCYAQNFVCDRLPNRNEISAPVAAQLESRNSGNTEPPSAFNITFNRPEHFTCLAVRGLNRYSHVAVALNYTTQLSNRSYIVQFILECNVNGTWSPLIGDNVIIRNVPSEVFDLPTSTSCSTCFFIINIVNRRRRQSSANSGCMGE